jgi:hypothetical protein
MTTCERLRAEAAGLVALPPGDPEREAAFAHAAGCQGCARALRQAERLQALLAEAEPGALPPGAPARAARAIEEELVREGRRRSGWSAGMAALAAVLLLAVARHRGGSALDWCLFAGLGAAAAALAGLAARRPGAALAGALLSALAAAGLAGHAGPLEAEAGLHCVLSELVCAGAVVWAGWMALRGGTTVPARSAVAAGAATGGLAGAAALQVTCGSHGVAGHLLLFHAGGLVLAVALAALLWRPRGASLPW